MKQVVYVLVFLAMAGSAWGLDKNQIPPQCAGKEVSCKIGGSCVCTAMYCPGSDVYDSDGKYLRSTPDCNMCSCEPDVCTCGVFSFTVERSLGKTREPEEKTQPKIEPSASTEIKSVPVPMVETSTLDFTLPAASIPSLDIEWFGNNGGSCNNVDIAPLVQAYQDALTRIEYQQRLIDIYRSGFDKIEKILEPKKKKKTKKSESMTGIGRMMTGPGRGWDDTISTPAALSPIKKGETKR